MSARRKPVHLEMKGAKSNRQRIWEVLRVARTGMTRAEIAALAKVEISTARAYLQGLLRAGYVAVESTRPLGDSRRKEELLRLVRDCGVDAPNVTSQGTQSRAGLGTEAMWRSLRILGDVSAEELAEQASVAVKTALSSAQSYLRWLRLAGYVMEVAPARGGQFARYGLVPGMYTGPKPPMVQRNGQVYDPNLGKVVYRHAEAREGAHA